MGRNPTLGSMMRQNTHLFTTPGSPSNYGIHSQIQNEPYANQEQIIPEFEETAIKPKKSKKEEFTATENYTIQTFDNNNSENFGIILRSWWVLILIIVCLVCFYKVINDIWMNGVSFRENNFKTLIGLFLPSCILLLFMFICGVPVLNVFGQLK